MSYELAGRTVAITGSTGGLGHALAKGLRSRGANLVLLDLDRDTVEAQAASLGGAHFARGLRADVRDIASLERAMEEGARHFGYLDVLIANAGIDTMAPMATLDPDAFDRVIDVNLNGVWRTFRAGLPHVQQRKGYLLGVSSMAAFVHAPLQASYTASKAAVWAMCNSIRLELKHVGVGVGSVHPAFFKTPMMEQVVADPAGRTLWGGNEKGMWQMIPIELVVSEVIAGIEQRADFIVVPKTHSLVANAPGVFRRFIERIGYTDEAVRRAIDLASSTGWNEPKH